MIRTALAATALLAAPVFAQDYVPPAGDEAWERRAPSEAGFDAGALEAAVAFAVENETRNDGALGEVVSARELTVMVPLQWAAEPYSDPVGPLQDRGEPSGLVIREGRIVAEWGEPERVDMTFSITKSFLAHTVGIALDDGLIADVHDAVAPYVEDERFHTDHNAPITTRRSPGTSSCARPAAGGASCSASPPGRTVRARTLMTIWSPGRPSRARPMNTTTCG